MNEPVGVESEGMQGMWRSECGADQAKLGTTLHPKRLQNVPGQIPKPERCLIDPRTRVWILSLVFENV